MAIVLIVSLLYYKNATFEFGNDQLTKTENDLACLCSLTLCATMVHYDARVATMQMSRMPALALHDDPRKTSPPFQTFAVHCTPSLSNSEFNKKAMRDEMRVLLALRCAGMHGCSSVIGCCGDTPVCLCPPAGCHDHRHSL
jgi:hypothetical protein